ncbi:hypothetical protein [Streptomyces sp. NPDC059979]|uniref:hypothetical protein n=1 Tax=Streptomyces sp. NPDC059979 TaxID=3347021 RepID=UPI00369427D3
MTPEQKTPSRWGRSPKPAPAAEKCDTCAGSGETTTTVRVGRKRREIGATQTGLCPICFGTGTA